MKDLCGYRDLKSVYSIRAAVAYMIESTCLDVQVSITAHLLPVLFGAPHCSDSMKHCASSSTR